jgi:hypothetical protein
LAGKLSKENTRMAGPAIIDAFLGFCAQRNPRLVHPIPQHTPYEQMLLDLERGDKAVQAAFRWAKNAQKASDEAILAEWRRTAASERAAVRRFVPVRHHFAPPPSEAAWLGLQLDLNGASETLLELYRRHDGAELFVDTEDGGSGLFCYGIGEMAAEREALAERLEGPVMETLEDGCLRVYGKPDWLGGAIVFAGFGYSPERLLLPTRGEHRGRVFLFDHDPPQLLMLQPGFDGLLQQLQQPVALLSRYGGASYQGAERYESDSAPGRLNGSIQGR